MIAQVLRAILGLIGRRPRACNQYRAGRDERHPVVCAWCCASIKAGNPKLPVSHGICGPCRTEQTRKFIPTPRPPQPNRRHGLIR